MRRPTWPRTTDRPLLIVTRFGQLRKQGSNSFEKTNKTSLSPLNLLQYIIVSSLFFFIFFLYCYTRSRAAAQSKNAFPRFNAPAMVPVYRPALLRPAPLFRSSGPARIQPRPPASNHPTGFGQFWEPGVKLFK